MATETRELQRLSLSIDLRAQARGTKFEGADDHAFMCRHGEGYRLDWWALEEDEKRHELEGVGVRVLTDRVGKDPNVRYVKAVAGAILDAIDEKRERGEIPTWNEIDTLHDAIDSAVDMAAESVARAWLADRRSIPLA